MAEENNLVIGATIDVEGLKTGLQTSVDEIKNSTANMGIAFTEMSTSALRATRQISDDTRDAAETISAEWTRAAEASLAYSRAQQEVRAATVLAKASASEDADATALLAAAKQKAAAASIELAAATKLTAASAGAEVGAFAAASAELKTMVAGFAEMFAITEIIEFFQHMKEGVVDLTHLSEATGVSVGKLAELKASMTESGISTDNVSQFMARLAKNMVSAAEGSSKQAQAFKDLGVNTEEWHGKLPPLDSVMMQIADHLHQTGGGAQNLGEGFSILGRNSVGLIAFLSQGSDAIREQMNSYSELGAETEKTAAAARQLQADEAQLSATLQTAFLPVFRALVEAFKFGAAEFIRVKAELENFGRGLLLVGTIMDETTTAVFGMNLALGKLDFAGAANIAKQTATRIKDDWSLAMLDMSKTTETAVTERAKFLKDAPTEESKLGGEVAHLPGKDTRLAEWKLELDQKRDAEQGFHELSKAEEAAYWQSKLEIARGTPKLYAEVYHEFVTAERAAKQQSLRDEVADVEARLAAVQRGSHEKITILTEELNHLRSLGAEETSEYKRLTTQLASVTREASESDKLEQEKSELAKVQIAKVGTLAREKAEQDFVAFVAKLYGTDSEQYKAALDRQATDHQKYVDAQRRMAEDEANHQEKMDELTLQGARQEFAAETQLGIVSNAQKLAAALNFAAEEHSIKLRALNDKLALLAKDPDTNAAELARLHNSVIEEDRRYENQKNQITATSVTYRKQLEQGFESTLKSGFSSAISGMIMGTQSFAQSFRQIMGGFVSTFANVLSEMLTQWITTHLLMKIVGSATTTDMNAAKATSDAAVAAGGTFAWWSSVNPLIAPAMAGAAFAEGMTWAGLAGAAGSAAGGALMDEDGPIFAHAGEMIIPSALSTGLRDLIGMRNVGTSGTSGSSNVTNHFHYTGGSVNALDGHSAASVMEKQNHTIEKIVRKSFKTGHLNPRQFMR